MKKYILMSCFENNMKMIGVFKNQDAATNKLRAILEELEKSECDSTLYELSDSTWGEYIEWGEYREDDGRSHVFSVFEV